MRRLTTMVPAVSTSTELLLALLAAGAAGAALERGRGEPAGLELDVPSDGVLAGDQGRSGKACGLDGDMEREWAGEWKRMGDMDGVFGAFESGDGVNLMGDIWSGERSGRGDGLRESARDQLLRRLFFVVVVSRLLMTLFQQQQIDSTRFVIKMYCIRYTQDSQVLTHDQAPAYSFGISRFGDSLGESVGVM